MVYTDTPYMTKLASRYYKGIEFIMIADLPVEQREPFTEWLHKDSIINIMIGQKVEKNCVQYTDYSYWFDHIFNRTTENLERRGSSSKSKTIGLAFDQ